MSWPNLPSLALIRLVPSAGRGLTGVLGGVIVVAGVAPVLAILCSGLLVQAIAVTGPRSETVRLLVLLALLFVLSQAAAKLASALAITLGSRLDARLQRRAIRAINRPSGVAHLDDPAMRDLLSRVTGVGMGGYTPGGAVSGLATNAVQLVQSLTALAVLSGYRWWPALLVFAAGLWWNRESRREYLAHTKTLAQQTKLLRRSTYLRDLVLRPAAAKEIRLFGLTGWLTDRFRTEWDRAMDVVWRQRGDRTFPALLALLGMIGANFLAFALLGADGVHRLIALGSAVIFLRSVSLVSQATSRGQQDMQIAYGLGSLPAVTSVERAVAEDVERPGAAPQDGHVRIELRGVRFCYPGTANPVLDGLDLEIPAAGSLAIVGANGAGKTTLIKLLCRFYDPDSGTILVNGTDLRYLDARRWQRQVSAVFQDFQRFDLPVRDNIGFGALPLLGDEAALRDAAARAGILERIEALPSGWDTPLARHLTGGADLSGGEWQRIALARGLLAVDAGARLLILDEPTASLDTRAEAAFYDRFLDLTHEVTTIVISHRFSTVRRADRICVLSDGRVAELGSHAELLGADGQYRRMYTAQSARFAEESS